MDLSLSEEQRLIRDTAHRFVNARYPFETRRAILQSQDGFSRQIWDEFATLGWLGLGIPESHGGLGADVATIGLVMEALGRGLVVEPYLATAVISAGLIAALGSPQQQSELLPAIAEGKSILAFAHVEPHARFALDHVATLAQRVAGGWRLSGRKQVVLGGPWADRLLVSARLPGGDHDRPRIGVFLVSPQAAGLRATPYQILDGSRASNIELDEVTAIALLGEEGALPAIEAVVDRAIAAMASEAVGCMQVLLDDTIQYTRTRIQFGRPLVDNQVLRHRMAAMAVKIEETRASALKAMLMVDSAPETRALAAASAKVKVGRAGRFVAEQAVQLHGGMGVTEELSVGAYFKRLMAIEMTFGTPEFHLRRHMRLRQQAADAAGRGSDGF